VNGRRSAPELIRVRAAAVWPLLISVAAPGREFRRNVPACIPAWLLLPAHGGMGFDPVPPDLCGFTCRVSLSRCRFSQWNLRPSISAMV